VLIDLPDPNGVDTLQLARILARQAGELKADLVVAGQASEDYEAAQVGPQVAEILGWPHVSLVTQASLAGNRLRIRRDAERTKEEVSLDMPAVLVVLSGREGEQRHPTLRGMMQAKKKSIPVVAPDLEPRTRLTWSEPVAEVREATGTILHDVPAPEAARQLVAWLRERKLA
jgi:electron transfer flavoprotein alpha/beta subunit